MQDYKIGDIIEIKNINNQGSVIDDSRFNGKTGVVDYIDNKGRLFGSWGGIALIPGQDSFNVIGFQPDTKARF